MSNAWDSRPPPIDHRPRSKKPRRIARLAVRLVIGFMAVVGCGFVGLLVWLHYATPSLEAAEAERFAAGAGATDHSCLTLAIEKARKDPPLLVSLDQSAFLSACLSRSDETDGFCSDAPSPYTSEGCNALRRLSLCPDQPHRRGALPRGC